MSCLTSKTPPLPELVRKWREDADAMRSNQPVSDGQRADELENAADELEQALQADAREKGEAVTAKAEKFPDPRTYRYPFHSMKVGDYFDMSADSRSLRTAASFQNSKSSAWFFTVKALPAGGVRCMRVW